MSHRITRGMGIATAALLAVALAACSGSGSSNTASSTPDVARNALASTGWTSADRSTIADGGTLTLPLDAAPANWQLSNLDSGTVDDNTVDSVFLATFVTIKADGTWQADPDYATSVKLTGKSPQTVEIKINPKAVWSDGTPMTEADIEANWKALNGSNPKFAPTATNVWQDVSSVKQGSDDRDAIITFKNVNADWPSVFTGIYPKWAMATPTAFNDSLAKGPFAADGTSYFSGGPFILTDFDADGGVLTFGRNPKWWGDTPKLSKLIFKVVSRDGLAQAYSNKEIDAFNLYGSADAYDTASSRADSAIERSLGTTQRQITLNGTSGVFADQKVRQAFARSLDRALLAKAILSPVKSPVEVLNNLILLPGQKGYTDDASSVIGYSTAKAKKLLTSDGYTIGSDGYATKGGKTLTVRFVIPSDNPNSASIAQLTQQEAKAAGFKVTIDTVPTNDFFTKYITTKTRDFDATYFAWQGTSFPISSTESIYYPANSGQNFTGITDDTLGAAWKKANSNLDPASRLTDAQTIDKKIVALAGTIPLFPEPYTWGVTKGLVNYGPTQFQTVAWQNVGFTK